MNWKQRSESSLRQSLFKSPPLRVHLTLPESGSLDTGSDPRAPQILTCQKHGCAVDRDLQRTIVACSLATVTVVAAFICTCQNIHVRLYGKVTAGRCRRPRLLPFCAPPAGERMKKQGCFESPHPSLPWPDVSYLARAGIDRHPGKTSSCHLKSFIGTGTGALIFLCGRKAG